MPHLSRAMPPSCCVLPYTPLFHVTLILCRDLPHPSFCTIREKEQKNVCPQSMIYLKTVKKVQNSQQNADSKIALGSNVGKPYELSTVMVASVSPMMTSTEVASPSSMMKRGRSSLSFASPNRPCRIMPRGPASVVVHRWDSAVDGTRPQAWPLRLEESCRGQVEAKEDSEEDEMDLHYSTS